VSTGCKHCYAETLSLRRGFTAVPWTQRNAAENVTLKPHKLREPLSRAKPWDQPCRVFVNSMSDLFHEEIPNEYIAQVFAVMAAAPQHTFQVLTKRPERMRELLSGSLWGILIDNAAREAGRAPVLPHRMADYEPLPNVWLGVSIENHKWAGRADVLRETPAAVRFISAEPLLGPLVPHKTPPFNEKAIAHICRGCKEVRLVNWWHRPPEANLPDAPPSDLLWRYCDDCWPPLDLTGIDWLIVGGESGSGNRPFDPQWARDLRDACEATGTAFFMKQMGGSRPGTALEDLPEDLRIREFPGP
jgi:protein gp37